MYVCMCVDAFVYVKGFFERYACMCECGGVVVAFWLNLALRCSANGGDVLSLGVVWAACRIVACRSCVGLTLRSPVVGMVRHGAGVRCIFTVVSPRSCPSDLAWRHGPFSSELLHPLALGVNLRAASYRAEMVLTRSPQFE